MSRAALLLVLCAGCARVPDREILFQARPPNDSENIWALNPRNGEVRRITAGDSSLAHAVPAWSPDGRSIAFTRELPDHDETLARQGLPLAPPVTGEQLGWPMVVRLPW